MATSLAGFTSDARAMFRVAAALTLPGQVAQPRPKLQWTSTLGTHVATNTDILAKLGRSLVRGLLPVSLNRNLLSWHHLARRHQRSSTIQIAARFARVSLHRVMRCRWSIRLWLSNRSPLLAMFRWSTTCSHQPIFRVATRYGDHRAFNARVVIQLSLGSGSCQRSNHAVI